MARPRTTVQPWTTRKRTPEVGNERLQHVGEKCSHLGSYISTTRRGTSANSTNLSFGRRPEPKSVEFSDVPLLYYRDVGDFRFETSETSDAVFRYPPPLLKKTMRLTISNGQTLDDGNGLAGDY